MTNITESRQQKCEFRKQIDNLNSDIRDIMLRCQKMQSGNFEDEITKTFEKVGIEIKNDEKEHQNGPKNVYYETQN